MKKLLPVLLAAAVCFSLAPNAKADALFVGSQTGICCFNVDLLSLSSTQMQVTVSLTNSATVFVNTGGGNHPGFAFSLNGDPTISITNISSPWSLSDVHYTSVSTNGPGLGTFDYFIDNPGSGGNLGNGGPLVFDITNASGISYTDFVTATGSNYYFAADIGIGSNTGMSAISASPVITSVPEPSSLALLGTGVLSAAGFIRRRLSA